MISHDISRFFKGFYDTRSKIIKKIFGVILPLAILFTSCGSTNNVPDTSSKVVVEDNSKNLQAAAVTCNYYLNDVRYYSCDQYQYNAVLTAGDIFQKSNLVGSERVLTIAVAKNGTELIVAVNGNAYATAKAKIQSETWRRGGTFIDPGGYTHAETAITDRYVMFNGRIGISNPNGPCSTCRGTIRGISISWFPNYYW